MLLPSSLFERSSPVNHSKSDRHWQAIAHSNPSPRPLPKASRRQDSFLTWITKSRIAYFFVHFRATHRVAPVSVADSQPHPPAPSPKHQGGGARVREHLIYQTSCPRRYARYFAWAAALSRDGLQFSPRELLLKSNVAPQNMIESNLSCPHPKYQGARRHCPAGGEFSRRVYVLRDKLVTI